MLTLCPHGGRAGKYRMMEDEEKYGQISCGKGMRRLVSMTSLHAML